MEQVGVKDNYRLVQNLKSAGCFIVCILFDIGLLSAAVLDDCKCLPWS